ncbi:asparagine synthase (glutamine-hydrolyzing) [Candidatus Woesebacteria bacterium RIFCSPHIGHO2_01_FULL_38_26b]|uniref:asparagine synthase (glutamine-hydrolyzing) n=1 Tax=Candidatus Woesebacteria bacterium RIFCSPHIGHO2_01_FULL_38_26b TaxID=1802491 RepID=A0A1F7Y1J9_9BACT|nr:MAG: asparagine synthase (glutamine-hydrolyzing) [Candidatus Woesebacteria bacterium RIFCSPHIGHO2_01_FULL_38_26b]
MCGIAGYVDFESTTNPVVLDAMTEEIIYRGPDSSGKYFNKDKSVGLGIRRLSIIDLSTGDQPIKNEDGSVTVVFNGEIYGYKNLRDRLINKGHKLKTKSDTEVLVHLYEEYGEEMVGLLNGMFAFAIWDEKKQKLFLARDRSGIKPLYYYPTKKKILFGSEPKTILKYPKIIKKINEEALSSYFYLGYVLGEKSIYKNVSKLLPGHYLIFDRNGLRIKKYFGLKTDKNVQGLSLDVLLGKSVEKQLIADVPVGVFLSGGLDSSLIAYYISKFKKLKSFSIGFSEPGFDESKHAYYVAKMLGTEHYSEEFAPRDVVNSFDDIMSKLDEPFADASIFPTYKVSKLAKRYVKVALSGDGGDELFGGYPTYQAHIMAKYLEVLPLINYDLLLNFLDYLPEFLLKFLPTTFKDYPKKKLAKIVLMGLKKKDTFERHLYWMRTFFLGEREVFKHSGSKLTLKNDDMEAIYSKVSSKAGQLIDFHTYLPDDFFFKVDRASMYNSLEVRVPFLDNDVVDYAFSTKDPHVNLFQTKIQLRKLLNEKLPDIARRPKKGFGIPLEKWLRGDLKELAYSMLTRKALYKFIDEKKVKRLWKQHQSLANNNAGVLWQLIIFSGWLNYWY